MPIVTGLRRPVAVYCRYAPPPFACLFVFCYGAPQRAAAAMMTLFERRQSERRRRPMLSPAPRPPSLFAPPRRMLPHERRSADAYADAVPMRRRQ